MNLVRSVARRVVLGAVAAWTLLTAIFAVFTMTEDWSLGRRIAMAFYGQRNVDAEDVEQMRQEYLAARGLDRPYHEQYLDWMGNMVTLQWGTSFETGEAVLPAVTSAAGTTGSYVVPAVVLAMAIGLAVGVYVTLRRGTVRADAVRSASYFGLGFPYFWVALVVLTLANVPRAFHRQTSRITPTDPLFLYATVLPAVLLTLVLAAAVVSYARAYSHQYAAANSIKLVRAKGGGPVAVARHLVRNAAIPLFSLAFTETFALLALFVFVIEALFGIEGLGFLIYNAVWARDLPMLLGGTLVVVSVGVASNVVQDVAYSTLDPRVDTGTR